MIIAESILICDGDSLTSGIGSTGGNNYPNQLLNLLGASDYDLTNLGVSGQTLSDMNSDFEIGDVNVTAAETFVNNQLTANGLSTTGNRQARFTRLLQFELRAGAVLAGFSQAQANLIVVTTIGFGNMDAAIVAAQTDIDANSSRWNNGI